MAEADPRNSPLFEQCYADLRRLASHIHRGRPDQSIEPTSLLHQAWMRLPGDSRWESQAHFMATAARAMRCVLADRARQKRTAKRGDGWAQVTLSRISSEPKVVDLVALDKELVALEAFDPRGAEIVVMRCLGGLTHEEIATVLDVSLRTVEREWRAARAWLRTRLDHAGQ